MSWAIASMELRNNQAQIKDISANGYLARRDQDLTYIDHNIKIVLYATVFSLTLLFFSSPPHGGSYTLYSFFLII